MQNNKTVTIVTMGCSKNLVDSEQLLHQFEAIGYNVQHNTEFHKGDIVIVNTCGFIGDAKEESVETILEYASLRKNGDISKLLVMGCLSERYFKELTEEIPEVDQFYGKFDWQKVLTDLGESYNDNLRLERHLTTPSHYAYLKISEGCSRTCSYCAIPIITGKHKSRPMEEILEEVRLLVNQGVKEFQLIAQDLSFYGKDLYKSFKLPELVEQISLVPGVEWIRLHYTYPHDFPVDLLRVMRERPNVCAYMDMALQHISDNMLTLMRRHINRKQTIDLLDLIRREVAGIHLRTTFMVGHPGETEADFNELCEFVKQARFERMGAFTYSEEEGTYAAKHYKDDIPEDIKQSRLDKLMLIQQGISEEINTAKIGQTMRVIVDREEQEYFVGRTEFDSPEVDPEVFISKEKKLNIGQFYTIKISSAEPYDLFGYLSEFSDNNI
jgi:ribosomal protein S12 methylthiotransferase